MRPNRLIARAYLFRGTKLWIVTRLALSGVFAVAEVNPLRLSAAAIATVIALSVAVGYADVQRRHEHVLLGNLGVPLLGVARFFAIPAFAGEVILFTLVLMLA